VIIKGSLEWLELKVCSRAGGPSLSTLASSSRTWLSRCLSVCVS